ncbi:MAG TPA: MGMT family protein [Chitinophagaceae bacterium]
MATKRKSSSRVKSIKLSRQPDSRVRPIKLSRQPESRAKPIKLSRQPESRVKSVKPSGKRDENFFELVFEVARQIPKGRVTSYGAIARCLGTKMSARMVGWAMNGAGKVRPRVPAHRIVNRMGMLSGRHHFDDPSQMERLLRKEGVKVSKDQVVDFQKVFWDPVTAFGL